jgi:ribosomal protein S18 acetylase RimI-like enzyme
MLVIRLAIAADVAALAALDTVAAQNRERSAEIAAWVAAGACHVALEAERPVGYAALTRSFFHRPFLEMLMVAAAARRLGVGQALVRHCIGLVPSGEDLWTSTNQSNRPMQLLLEGLGFVRSGSVDLDPGDPEFIFRWPAGASGDDAHGG